MPRGTRYRPAELTVQQHELYEALTGGDRASLPGGQRIVDEEGVLVGPFNAMLHNPAVGGPLQALGTALRNHVSLDPRVREMVILLVAHHLGSDVERVGHERIARALDLPEDAIAALGAGTIPTGLPAQYAESGICALELAGQLLTGERIGEGFDAAVAVLGEAGVFDVTALVGYYWTLARQLAVFGLEPNS